jgi:NADH dehydrogenase FAD-containing subunit
MAKILILGGGFAAVAAAEEFARSGGDLLEVTVVSASRNFTFYPAMVPYVFGNLDREKIRFDLASKLAANRIRFVEGEVLSVDQKRQIAAVTGNDLEGLIHFDYLVIALGRRPATERVAGFHEHAHHLLDLEAADRFKTAIGTFRSGSIVVGVSPGGSLPLPVCESALALADKFAEEIKAKKVSVSAVFPKTLEESLQGSGVFRDLRSAFEKKGIDLITNFPIERIARGAAFSVDGACVRFDLLMLVPPFHGQSRILTNAGFSSNSGFAEANDYMQVNGNPRIYAAGDIVSVPGPQFGYMAVRQAKVAARNIIAQAAGNAPQDRYEHSVEWAVGEKYSDPAFFHYGFWDESLDDFDENDFFGMAKPVRENYGPIKGFGRPLEPRPEPRTQACQANKL